MYCAESVTEMMNTYQPLQRQMQTSHLWNYSLEGYYIYFMTRKSYIFLCYKYHTINYPGIDAFLVGGVRGYMIDALGIL